ncbi:hypothetical protein LXL04_000056 [Taraxacum kok-saghyz]
MALQVDWALASGIKALIGSNFASAFVLNFFSLPIDSLSLLRLVVVLALARLIFLLPRMKQVTTGNLNLLAGNHTSIIREEIERRVLDDTHGNGGKNTNQRQIVLPPPLVSRALFQLSSSVSFSVRIWAASGIADCYGDSLLVSGVGVWGFPVGYIDLHQNTNKSKSFSSPISHRTYFSSPISSLETIIQNDPDVAHMVRLCGGVRSGFGRKKEEDREDEFGVTG